MQCKIFFFSEKNLKISKYHFSLISGTHSSVSWRDLSDSCQPPLVTGGSQVSTRTSIFLIEFSSTVANHILMEIIAAERGSIKVSGSWHGVTSPAGWRLLTLLADISESSGGQFYVYSGNTINEMCLLSKDKILVKITTLYHTGQTFPPALLNHLPHPLHVLPPVLPIQLGRQVVDRGGGVGVAQQGLDTDWSRFSLNIPLWTLWRNTEDHLGRVSLNFLEISQQTFSSRSGRHDLLNGDVSDD